MKLHACFEMIGRKYLESDQSATRKLVERVVGLLRREFGNGPIPCEGWLLVMEATPRLVHKEARVFVPLPRGRGVVPLSYGQMLRKQALIRAYEKSLQ